MLEKHVRKEHLRIYLHIFMTLPGGMGVSTALVSRSWTIANETRENKQTPEKTEFKNNACRSYLTRGLGEMCGARVEDAYPWPTCETHYKLVTEYGDFNSWMWDSLHDPHGPVHMWLGGNLDCKETYDKIGALIGKDVSWRDSGTN